MSQSKYRGKRVDGKGWAIGYLVIHNDGYAGSDKVYEIFSGESGYGFNQGLNFVRHPVFPETVGQFIGWKDKNLKEICDGDLLQNTTAFYCHKVLWLENAWCLQPILNEKGKALLYADSMIEYNPFPITQFNVEKDEFVNEDMSSFEIIGNIHTRNGDAEE